MKARVLHITLAALLLCACAAWAQQQPQIYDQQYRGPRNYYGYPTYEPSQMPRPAPGQPPVQQQPYHGVISWGADAAYQTGSYLWGYMPAPLRGVNGTYKAPQDSYVIQHFVPGTQ